ncbi:MAG TPA: ABC transporter ATP-binding protein [Bacteroidales bacterium]|nr:ABC transporter ATP-binding protein [Bacteroidales bacterium]
MIEITNVSKFYGETGAVKDITLSIGSNTLFGLIGPDGAGKTTLFRMITTLLIPDKGIITVKGFDTVTGYAGIRKFTGYMPGRFSLYPDLTVSENLTFYATIFGTTVDANYHLIKPVYSFLEPFKNRLAQNLSGGMKQKLALCCALIHNPALLVLDEPTTGVDAVSRKEFWETLHELKESGMTILVSTPYMDEAERCDRVALMQDGMVMTENTPGAILADFSTPLYEIHTADRLKTLEVVRSIRNVQRAYLFGHSIHVALDSPDVTVLEKELSARNTEARICSIEPDFEDCFIEAVESHNTSAK